MISSSICLVVLATTSSILAGWIRPSVTNLCKDKRAISLLTGSKQERMLYVKQLTQLGNAIYLFYDLQIRQVHYQINGFRNNPLLFVDNNYTFFNPKVGITYSKKTWRAYASFSRGAEEPNRDDFEAGTIEQPRAELLNDHVS